MSPMSRNLTMGEWEIPGEKLLAKVVRHEPSVHVAHSGARHPLNAAAALPHLTAGERRSGGGGAVRGRSSISGGGEGLVMWRRRRRDRNSKALGKENKHKQH
ncbi:hypothetical protein E2C01_017878 [Portunus trituberculatus]|uniref:Uncharacterized protein n=1 Tax=Portunus trituberculatus TaxID=210409 RepID=A0A5B7DV04_PORTR|nr:hypothetical protein [Portunus trituberculatus]